MRGTKILTSQKAQAGQPCTDSVCILLNQGGSCVLVGDVNGDGVVNLLDVSNFVALLVAGDFQDEADVNRDGVVDLLDVEPFIELLNAG